MFDLVLPVKDFCSLDLSKLIYYYNTLELVYGKNSIHVIVSHDDYWTLECEYHARKIADLGILHTILRGTKNVGKGSAIKKALSVTRHPFCVFTDADFSYSVTQIIRLVDLLKNGKTPFVVGVRKGTDSNYQSKKRLQISSLVRFFNHSILGFQLGDTQCGLKGMSRDQFPLLQSIKNDRFFFDWELIFTLEWLEIPYQTIEVTPQFYSFSTSFSRKTILLELLDLIRHRFVWFSCWSIIFIICYFMFHLSFHPNENGKQFNILDKISSDFSSHLPLIRSFSYGENKHPVEFPLLAHAPIRYHYLFYWMVGKLESLGVRLDIALNFLSALGFFLLLVAIYYLTKRLTSSWKWGGLGILLGFSNPTLSWWYYLESKQFSILKSFSDLPQTRDFIGFAPWKTDNLISAFWPLNIFLNQRHLAFAIGILGLFLLYQLWPRKLWWHGVAWGLIIGGMYWFHKSILIIFAIILVINYLFSKEKSFYFVAGISSFITVALQFYSHPQEGADAIQLVFGYLLSQPITWKSFLHYWWINLGISLFTIILGFLFLPRRWKIVFLPLFLVFILGMSVKFSMEAAANHKFFNVYYLLGIPLTILFWQNIYHFFRNIKVICAALLFVISIHLWSGVVDFMPTLGHSYRAVPLEHLYGAYEYFLKTPKNSVVVNNEYMYHPASMAGRKIAMGWPYFAWSMGHKLEHTMEDLKRVYTMYDIKYVCDYLTAFRADYFTVSENNSDRNAPFADVAKYLKLARPDWIAPDGRFLIYSKKNLCSFLKR